MPKRRKGAKKFFFASFFYKKMQSQLITTSDGSHSIYIPELDEHYHSVHGAIQESKHVFIEAGLKHAAAKHNTLHILEIGFGTGLNALLTMIETANSTLQTKYTSIEAFPISTEMAAQLNYMELLHAQAFKENFERMHSCEWEKEINILPNFSFCKRKTTLQEIQLTPSAFDLIYFDAFGPPTQPEMWTESIFQKMYNCMKPGSALVTYCAKGEVKRTLKKVGFNVESLQGPPGKREMVRAVRNS